MTTINKFFAVILCCLSVSAANRLDAQFLQYLPDLSNYISSDAKSDASGMTFFIHYQDTTLAHQRVLLRTDNDGQPQWAKRVDNMNDYTIAPDSSIVFTGGIRMSGGNYSAVIQKNDKAGNYLWTTTVRTSSDCYIGNPMVNDSNIIYVIATASSFFNSTYYSKSAVMGFDKDGQRLWTKHFANGGFTTDYGFSRTYLAANGDFIGVADIRGSANAPANGMMITRINQQGNIVFSRYFNFRATHNQLSVTGLTELPSGDIVLGGRLMTDQISTTTNTMWVDKMDAAGNTLAQKTYHGGETVGELLHSLRYGNGKLYAYLHILAPSDTVVRKIMIAELDPQSLSMTAHYAVDIPVTTEDPYGNVNDAFCITSDGKPTLVGGFYCDERKRYLATIIQLSSAFEGSCEELEVTQTLIDSVATYTDTVYTSMNTSTFTVGTADTVAIKMSDIALPTLADLCNGCGAVNNVATLKPTSHIQVYPNPGTGIYTLNIAGIKKGAIAVIYNNMGASIYRRSLNTENETIDISAQPAGIYYLRVSDGQTLKLIKY